ncbi:rRNA-processing protein [Coemansia sp. RSA 2611]|nr:rRNA-processing protein [Coemansia sp. RSA 2611]
MALHPRVPGVLVTGSADETLKVWDVRDHRPKMVVSRNVDVGSVFAARFCPDEPMLLAAAGSSGESRIWDMSTSAPVRAVFGGAVAAGAAAAAEKPLVRVQHDEDEDDDHDNTHAAVIAELRGTAANAAAAAASGEDSDASMASD